MQYYVIAFILGVIFTIIAEFVAVYFYGRSAAERRAKQQKEAQ